MLFGHGPLLHTDTLLRRALVAAQGIAFAKRALTGQPEQRSLGTVSYLRRDCVGVRLKGKINDDGHSITFASDDGEPETVYDSSNEWLQVCEAQEDDD